MTTTLLRSEPTTCATCPLATHIDRDRYQCTATHNHHNPVTRGHWQATGDCYSVLELDLPSPDECELVAPGISDFELPSPDDSWLTEPIGANPLFIFGEFIEPSDEEIATFPVAENAYHDPDFDVYGGEF